MTGLRTYQTKIVSALREAIRAGHRSPLVVAPTGAGKTVIFSHVAKGIASKNKKVLILAHRDMLIRQASNKLRVNKLSHGIIMAKFSPDYHANVQVGSVQTLVRRLGKIRFVPDYIFVDEAHLSCAASYRKIFDHYPNAIIVGFTGSPCRLDGKPLGRDAGGIYDELINEISVKELIELGFLVKPLTLGAERIVDLSGIKKKGSDWDMDKMAEVMDTPSITGDAIESYRTHCDGVPAVAWCANLEHARHVAEQFTAAGYPAVMLCGDDPSDVRESALKKLESGEIKVIAFVGILIEGVDCPAIEAIILLRHTMSLSSYLQVIGRGLRPYTTPSGRVKTMCYVLDHVSLWVVHGFADDVREWDLNTVIKQSSGKKEKREKLSDKIQCKSCWAVFDPLPACPHCGKEVEVKGRKQIEHVEGDLVIITEEMKVAIQKKKKTEVKNAKSLEDLRKIEAERGYKRGWAEHQFNARVQKRSRFVRDERPPEPTPEELSMMTLDELKKVAREQSWPPAWPYEFFNQRGLSDGTQR